MTSAHMRCSAIVSSIWGIAILILLSLIFVKRRRQVGTEEDADLPNYCGARPHGAEGHHARLGLVLHAVLITIRHGDRSAIHALPNTNASSRWLW